jgi:hypothetical protein
MNFKWSGFLVLLHCGVFSHAFSSPDCTVTNGRIISSDRTHMAPHPRRWRPSSGNNEFESMQMEVVRA